LVMGTHGHTGSKIYFWNYRWQIATQDFIVFIVKIKNMRSLIPIRSIFIF
jgi:hypothetical protein